MTKRLFFLAGTLALTSVAPAFAATADAPAKPLRTMTWDLTMAVGTMRRQQTSGMRDADPQGNGFGGTGSGNAASGGSAESKGTITVDVIAVAPEGIVVDVVENASGRARPKVRVAITNAGALKYDPQLAQSVSAEEVVLLPMLARNFLGESTSPGSKWDVDGSGNGVSSVEHFSVKSKADTQIALDYKVESSAKGMNAFNSTRLGTIVYDAKYVVPVKLAYQEILSQDRLGQSDRTTTSVDMKLASDTFKKT